MDRELLNRVKRLIESYEQTIERMIQREIRDLQYEELDEIETELKARARVDDLVDDGSTSMSGIASVHALEIELREVSIALIDHELHAGVQ